MGRKKVVAVKRKGTKERVLTLAPSLHLRVTIEQYHYLLSKAGSGKTVSEYVRLLIERDIRASRIKRNEDIDNDDTAGNL